MDWIVFGLIVLFHGWFSRRPFPAASEQVLERIALKKWFDALMVVGALSLFAMGALEAAFIVSGATNIEVAEGFGFSFASSAMGWTFLVVRKRSAVLFTSAGVYYVGMFKPWDRVAKIESNGWTLKISDTISRRLAIQIAEPVYAIASDQVAIVEGLRARKSSPNSGRLDLPLTT